MDYILNAGGYLLAYICAFLVFSPVIAALCFLSAFFAWYYELKEYIKWLVIGVIFTAIYVIALLTGIDETFYFSFHMLFIY